MPAAWMTYSKSPMSSGSGRACRGPQLDLGAAPRAPQPSGDTPEVVVEHRHRDGRLARVCVVPGERRLDQVVAQEAGASGDQHAPARHRRRSASRSSAMTARSPSRTPAAPRSGRTVVPATSIAPFTGSSPYSRTRAGRTYGRRSRDYRPCNQGRSRMPLRGSSP